jgi:DNA-binding response OmpR family regulator
MSKIVVIERDLAMRTLISEWLIAAGHLVQAWATVRDGHRCDADIVVLGISNLRSQAEQTVADVRTWCAQSTIIGISAQLARSLAGDSAVVLALGLNSLIAKPCTRDELLAAVTHAIEANG